jgi:N-methylhydantoinase A
MSSGWNWRHRYIVGLSMVDVESIGAGGGSIAGVEAGALRVGPRSAGSEPGPICYGRGGTQPTLTDADLVLGYIDPGSFRGSGLCLQRGGVDEAILRAVGGPLELSLEEAAYGIFRLANASMANAIRRLSARRGVDLRDLVLVAYGGSAPIHAPMHAEELGLREVLIPRAAPVLSALGLLLADPLTDELRSYVTPAKQIALERVNALFSDMEAKAVDALAREGTVPREINRFAQLRYPGQTFELMVPVATRKGHISGAEIEATIERFHELHRQIHGDALRDEEPILQGLRLRAVGLSRKPELPRVPRARGPASSARSGKRRAYFEGGYATVPVYDGSALRAGHRIKGPAIVEEPFTTVVVHPGHRAEIDAWGNYRLTLD